MSTRQPPVTGAHVFNDGKMQSRFPCQRKLASHLMLAPHPRCAAPPTLPIKTDERRHTQTRMKVILYCIVTRNTANNKANNFYRRTPQDTAKRKTSRKRKPSRTNRPRTRERSRTTNDRNQRPWPKHGQDRGRRRREREKTESANRKQQERSLPEHTCVLLGDCKSRNRRTETGTSKRRSRLWTKAPPSPSRA